MNSPAANQELIDRLNYIQIQPKTVWLSGDFSGEEQRNIQKIYPNAKLYREPLLASFEVILGVDISGDSAVFERIFQSFKQHLAPGGMLLFTQLGRDFKEGFPDMHDIGDLLLHLEFENPVMDTEFKRIFGHGWAKQSQEKNEDGSVKTVRVSLDRLLESLKKPFRR